MELLATKKRPIRAKLIFNPGAGATGVSPIQLMDVVHGMQAWNIVPEAYLVEPGCDVPGAVQAALDDGIRAFPIG